ncbi:MAG: Ldh family oxidoreductase, partial [Alphaproteobacteria bacterium]|nr:Ldh family oxidoreductase [Alphaproteobacteria bacterium]
MTKRIPEATLLDIARRILEGEGAPSAERELVARHLVDANLKGHDSHGVAMLETYVKHAKAGTLKPANHGIVLSERPPFLQVDGERGHGQVVAHDATRRAIAAARATGACIMAIRNAHHMGRIGTYGEMAAAAGLTAIIAVNVTGHRGLVAPHGGSDGRLGTNPLCIAVPGPTADTPFVLDMATSKVAVGKIRVSMNKGEELPEDMVLDPQGQPTRDPATMFDEPGGAVLPIGEHKGYGLGLAIDILAGAMTGGGTLQPR